MITMTMTRSWSLPFLCETKRSSLSALATKDGRRSSSGEKQHDGRTERPLVKEEVVVDDGERKRKRGHSAEEEEKRTRKKEWS